MERFPNLCFSLSLTCTQACASAVTAARGAALALSIVEGVFRGTGIQALVIVEDPRLMTAQAVCGVPLTCQAALCTADTHLTQREATEGGIKTHTTYVLETTLPHEYVHKHAYTHTNTHVQVSAHIHKHSHRQPHIPVSAIPMVL